ncbi:MAG TPA: hypothetical protein VNO75_03925 [Gemmatimonadaceae bacterium]|nr:hypothetical protein [Gemmatimonadaceae bacterium]
MDENRFNDVLSGLPRSFKVPPEPPLDEMWRVIEDAHFNAPAAVPYRRGITSGMSWLAAAATLLIGIGIGYYLPSGDTGQTPGSASPLIAAAPATGDTSKITGTYRDQTSEYLGQAAALLISLPAEGAADRSDSRFAGKAADLLVTTRLLMDSPAAQDPKIRGLLEDLELVLVQIARLRIERNRSDLDLIHQTVEQGDVLERLSSAVVNNQAE